MNNRANLRIVHGPVNVGNQPWVLSRNERELGARSDLVVNYSTWLGYPSDACLSPYSVRSWRSTLRRLGFGLTAPLRYDVLHYYFGRSFLCWDDYAEPNSLWFSDLRIAKMLGRKVFMTLQGCDVRLSAESAIANAVTPCREGHCSAVPVCRSTLDARRRDLISRILPKADRLFILNPELARYVPGAVFLPYSNVDVGSFEARLPKPAGRPVVLHAPSDEAIKGSRLILEALDALKSRIPFDLVVVKGRPHAEAMELYQKADLVIDQVLAGWYGGLAVEVMAMGKPVACYIRDEDLSVLPVAMREELPILRLNVATLKEDLESILTRQSEWPELGDRSRRFVHRWHHPRKIAQAMINAYADPDSRFDLGTVIGSAA